MSEEQAPARLSIVWSDEARADLRRIDRQTALDILHCADRYLATRNGDVKKLKPPQTGFRLLLRLAQFGSVPFEDAERRNDSSIGERGKADHSQVDAYGIALGDRLFYFAFGLDGDEPFAIAAADGDIADRAKNFPAVPVTNPAEFWQEDSAVGLIELESLGKAEAVPVPTLFETWVFCPFLEEVGEGTIQVLERMLQGL